MSHLPTILFPKDAKASFCIAQLSDLHLNAIDDARAERFLQVLALAVADGADLLLLTGDLVDDGKTLIYDWLFDTLAQTGIPYLCLAGNHDVTQELNKTLAFAQRQHRPISMDPRLPSQHRLLIHPSSKAASAMWQLITLSSAVAGQAYGALTDDNLRWLDDTLQKTVCPTLVALHHHPVAVGSAWIDALMLRDHHQLWRWITRHAHVKALLCGHVHQAHNMQILWDTNNLGTPSSLHAPVLELSSAEAGPKPYSPLAADGLWCLTCPAISRQFLPHHQTFATQNIGAGYRMIQLCNTGALATWVKRHHTMNL